VRILATYNIKGGVGKTASAVNLAWLASHEGMRTLVWDLDPQGAASFYLGAQPTPEDSLSDLLDRKRGLAPAVTETGARLIEC
jgi:cellulose biosynthesis protein BcsQ